MRKFAVLVKPFGVYVKEWEFFVKQGGLNDGWGKAWRPIKATSIEDARSRGERLRDRSFKRAAARNAKAFGSTKSKDGMYPI